MTLGCCGDEKAENFVAAEQILRFALKFLPDEGLIHYHLACYAAQLGHLDEARDRLKVALDARGDLKHKALEEPDLEPMRKAGLPARMIIVRHRHRLVRLAEGLILPGDHQESPSPRQLNPR